MRAIFQRDWRRVSYRVPVRLRTRVNGRTAVTREGSATGVAVEGTFDGLNVGGTVSLELTLDDETALTAQGTIAGRWVRGDHEVMGISLDVVPTDRIRWIAQLSRAATAATQRTGRPETKAVIHARRPLHQLLLGRSVAVIVTLAAVSAMATPCLALVGYRPLVIRSGSMEPALHPGDVVLVKNVLAGHLGVHDIATFADPSDIHQTMTHRVADVVRDGGHVTVITRGDANLSGESFTTTSTTTVGRVVWRLPRVGTWIAWSGRAAFRWTAAAAAVSAAIALWLIGGLTNHRKHPTSLPRRL
jgi:signal peptidase I